MNKNAAYHNALSGCTSLGQLDGELLSRSCRVWLSLVSACTDFSSQERKASFEQATIALHTTISAEAVVAANLVLANTPDCSLALVCLAQHDAASSLTSALELFQRAEACSKVGCLHFSALVAESKNSREFSLWTHVVLRPLYLALLGQVHVLRRMGRFEEALGKAIFLETHSKARLSGREKTSDALMDSAAGKRHRVYIPDLFVRLGQFNYSRSFLLQRPIKGDERTLTWTDSELFDSSFTHPAVCMLVICAAVITAYQYAARKASDYASFDGGFPLEGDDESSFEGMYSPLFYAPYARKTGDLRLAVFKLCEFVPLCELLSASVSGSEHDVEELLASFPPSRSFVTSDYRTSASLAAQCFRESRDVWQAHPAALHWALKCRNTLLISRALELQMSVPSEQQKLKDVREGVVDGEKGGDEEEAKEEQLSHEQQQQVAVEVEVEVETIPQQRQQQKQNQQKLQQQQQQQQLEAEFGASSLDGLLSHPSGFYANVRLPRSNGKLLLHMATLCLATNSETHSLSDFGFEKIAKETRRQNGSVDVPQADDEVYPIHQAAYYYYCGRNRFSSLVSEGATLGELGTAKGAAYLMAANQGNWEALELSLTELKRLHTGPPSKFIAVLLEALECAYLSTCYSCQKSLPSAGRFCGRCMDIGGSKTNQKFHSSDCNFELTVKILMEAGLRGNIPAAFMRWLHKERRPLFSTIVRLYRPIDAEGGGGGEVDEDGISFGDNISVSSDTFTDFSVESCNSSSGTTDGSGSNYVRAPSHPRMHISSRFHGVRSAAAAFAGTTANASTESFLASSASSNTSTSGAEYYPSILCPAASRASSSSSASASSISSNTSRHTSGNNSVISSTDSSSQKCSLSNPSSLNSGSSTFVPYQYHCANALCSTHKISSIEAAQLEADGEDAQASFMLCSRCTLVFYCSVDCQRVHWKEHRKVCRSPSTSTF